MYSNVLSRNVNENIRRYHTDDDSACDRCNGVVRFSRMTIFQNVENFVITIIIRGSDLSPLATVRCDANNSDAIKIFPSRSELSGAPLFSCVSSSWPGSACSRGIAPQALVEERCLGLCPSGAHVHNPIRAICRSESSTSESRHVPSHPNVRESPSALGYSRLHRRSPFAKRRARVVLLSLYLFPSPSLSSLT